MSVRLALVDHAGARRRSRIDIDRPRVCDGAPSIVTAGDSAPSRAGEPALGRRHLRSHSRSTRHSNTVGRPTPGGHLGPSFAGYSVGEPGQRDLNDLTGPVVGVRVDNHSVPSERARAGLNIID
jgi:hypothetical protein